MHPGWRAPALPWDGRWAVSPQRLQPSFHHRAEHGECPEAPHEKHRRRAPVRAKGRKGPSTGTPQSPGAPLTAWLVSVRFQGRMVSVNLGNEGRLISLRKLEVSHNESCVWQRQGICFNIIALKKVKCLCGAPVWGGRSLCEGIWLPWSRQEKLTRRRDINIPSSWREEGGIGLHFGFSEWPHY